MRNIPVDHNFKVSLSERINMCMYAFYKIEYICLYGDMAVKNSTKWRSFNKGVFFFSLFVFGRYVYYL